MHKGIQPYKISRAAPPFTAVRHYDEFMLNTRLVMTAAAVFLGLAGAACLFLPDEVLKLYSIDSSTSSVQTQSQTAGAQILIQILGGCFLALASLDWFSKRAILGGIYGRPVVGTNYAHFVI